MQLLSFEGRANSADFYEGRTVLKGHLFWLVTMQILWEPWADLLSIKCKTLFHFFLTARLVQTFFCLKRRYLWRSEPINLPRLFSKMSLVISGVNFNCFFRNSWFIKHAIWRNLKRKNWPGKVLKKWYDFRHWCMFFQTIRVSIFFIYLNQNLGLFWNSILEYREFHIIKSAKNLHKKTTKLFKSMEF